MDGRRKPVRPVITYTDILKMDTGLKSTDFKSAMGDSKAWGTIGFKDITRQASKKAR